MITILEADSKFHEAYKLDIQIEYSIEDEGIAIDAIPSKVVLETLGETIEEEIINNKMFICKDNQFKDFSIEYDNYNDRDGILTYTVETEFKIMGKYFVDKVVQVLDEYKTIVYHNNQEISVVVENVSPMLRYIGSI